ncbi:MAG: hypothetical protein IH851_12865, partial [Armatimonadetes bacterium]|nr:hypothetical protein [Armatimonadota bacterium]
MNFCLVDSAVLRSAMILAASIFAASGALSDYRLQVASGPNKQLAPRVSGDYIAYNDRDGQGGDDDIYVFDIRLGRVIASITGPWNDNLFDIRGSWILYEDQGDISRDSRLILWNFLTNQRTTVAAWPEYSWSSTKRPRMSDSYVVFWSRDENIGTDNDVVAYNRSTTATKRVPEWKPNPGEPGHWDTLNFAIDGSRVVTMDDVREAQYHYHDYVNVYDLSAGDARTVIRRMPEHDYSAQDLDISGDYVVWKELRSGEFHGVRASRISSPAPFDVMGGGGRPMIFGDLIVFKAVSSLGDDDIWLYNLAAGGQPWQLERRGATQGRPHVDANAEGYVIVWEEYQEDSLGDIRAYLLTGQDVIWNPYEGPWNARKVVELHAHSKEPRDGQWNRARMRQYRDYTGPGVPNGFDYVALSTIWPVHGGQWIISDPNVSGVVHIPSLEAVRSWWTDTGTLWKWTVPLNFTHLASHILGINVNDALLPPQLPGNPPGYGLTERQRVGYITQAGGFAILAHPFLEEGHSASDVFAAGALRGIEIYNGVVDRYFSPNLFSDLVLWDEVLRSALFYYGYSTGDAFALAYIGDLGDGMGRGWIEVITPRSNPTYADVLSAVQRGSFVAKHAYLPGTSDPGPPGLTSLNLAGRTIEVRSDNPFWYRFMTAQTDSRRQQAKPATQVGNEWVATYPASQIDRYVRVEMYARQPRDAGRAILPTNLLVARSWTFTQPIFFSEAAGSGAGDFVGGGSTLHVGAAYLDLPGSVVGSAEGRIVPIQDLPATPPPSGYVGNVYEFTGTGVVGDLTVRYDSSDAQIINDDSLKLFRYDALGGDWVNLQVGSVNANEHTFFAPISEPGTYAISAPDMMDFQPPVVIFGGPPAGSDVSGQIHVGASATDDNGVSNMRFLARKVGYPGPYDRGWTELGYAVAPISLDGWGIEVDFDTLPNAGIELRVEGQDASGNVSTDGAVVNNLGGVLAPSIAIVSPSSGQQMLTSEFAAWGTFSTFDGEGTVELFIDEFPLGLAEVNGNTWSYAVPVPSGLAGQRTLTAVVSDQYGNQWEADVQFTLVGVVTPDSFSVVRGLLIGGKLPDLFDSDDSRLVVRTAVFAPSIEPPVQIEVVGTSPTETPSELRFRFEGTASRDLIQRRISMYNYVTQSYEELHVAFAATSDEVVEIVITSNPSRFVEPGTRQVKSLMTWKAAAFSFFTGWNVG